MDITNPWDAQVQDAIVSDGNVGLSEDRKLYRSAK
jgi:hypothetical protein